MNTSLVSEDDLPADSMSSSLAVGAETVGSARLSDRTARLVLAVDRLVLQVARHWLLYASLVLGALVLTPFAAPLLMALGVTGPAKVIYLIYGLLCHQLPERSFFLFGAKVSYSLGEISRVWAYDGLFSLRQFVGNGEMGWKVAWSDRMVWLFGGAWVAGLLYAALRKRLPPLSPFVWLFIGVIPLGLDGLTHTVNDAFFGFSGTGFRDTNAWLQFLTGNAFPLTFYQGDALGSFNSLMRLVTGALFGILSVWFIYPIVDYAMRDWHLRTRARLSTPRAIQLGMGVMTPTGTEKG